MRKQCSFPQNGLSGRRVFIVTGHTDLRKSVDGLNDIVSLQYGITPTDENMFIFCGIRRDRLKQLVFDSGVYHLIYSRANEIRYKWPREENELWEISQKQLHALLIGEKLQREDAKDILYSRV